MDSSAIDGDLWPKSRSVLQRAFDVSACARPDLEGGFPCVIRTGRGAYVTDEDDRSYLDLTAAYGAISLGHRAPAVDEAVKRHIDEVGSTFVPTITRLQVDLAERLMGIFPAAERAAFFRTGSEATTALVRLARVFTGRDLVLTSGYHGWHDWQLNIFPSFRMDDARHVNFGYNLNLLESLIARRRDEIACVFITPEPNFFEPEYFRELESIVRSQGLLLCYDEVVTGFRLQPGGFQARTGILPDLFTISKGLANGHALAALLGRRDVMAARNRTHIDGTFSFDTLPMAAAMATLDVYETTDYYAHLERVGARLRDGLNAAFRRHGVRAEAKRMPQVFHVIFEQEDFGTEFYREMLRRGVLMQPLDSPTFVTAAHTDLDVDRALQHADSSLTAVCERFPEYRSAPAAAASVNALALNRRTLCEFGAIVDYRGAIEDVPHVWADAGTREDAVLSAPQ